MQNLNIYINVIICIFMHVNEEFTIQIPQYYL